jgi:hypothetical protein
VRRESNLGRRDQQWSRRYGNVDLLIRDSPFPSVLPVSQAPPMCEHATSNKTLGQTGCVASIDRASRSTGKRGSMVSDDLAEIS